MWRGEEVGAFPRIIKSGVLLFLDRLIEVILLKSRHIFMRRREPRPFFLIAFGAK